jgi:hypothetical protein
MLTAIKRFYSRDRAHERFIATFLIGISLLLIYVAILSVWYIIFDNFSFVYLAGLPVILLFSVISTKKEMIEIKRNSKLLVSFALILSLFLLLMII